MNNLYFESYEQFLRDIDLARFNMFHVDHTEIKQTAQMLDLDKVNIIPDGRWDVEWENVQFECFFHRKESKRLYVFLNGAVSEIGADIPMFRRWSYYKFVDGSVINISDPMYKMYDQLKLGWYYGNEVFDLRKKVAEFVLAVALKLDVKQDDIIFVGSSGGGCAAIGCASYIRGATSISINPQIILAEYEYSTQFTTITGIDLTKKDKWNRNNTMYYLHNNTSNVNFMFVNVRSKADMQQIKNICDGMGEIVKYGLNIFSNLVIWLYDADMTPYISPHSLQENYCIWFMLEFLVVNKGNIKKLNEYDSLFRLINEFYYDRRKSEKECRSRIPDLEFLWQCKRMDRKTVIFGLGNLAEALNGELLNIEGRNYYNIQFAIDNNLKDQEDFHGLPVIHPLDIKNWRELYTIISCEKYCDEIKHQLEKLGLVYKEDFVTYHDLFK